MSFRSHLLHQQLHGLSLPHEWRVSVYIPTNSSCQQQSLNIWNQAPRHLFSQERMSNHFLFALLPSSQYGFPPSVIKEYATILSLLKITS